MGINGYALLINSWRVCGGVPNVGSGVECCSRTTQQPPQKPYTMRQDLPGKLWVMSGTATLGQLGCGVLHMKDVTQKL